jgi:hypothetical protein
MRIQSNQKLSPSAFAQRDFANESPAASPPGVLAN